MMRPTLTVMRVSTFFFLLNLKELRSVLQRAKRGNKGPYNETNKQTKNKKRVNALPFFFFPRYPSSLPRDKNVCSSRRLDGKKKNSSSIDCPSNVMM